MCSLLKVTQKCIIYKRFLSYKAEELLNEKNRELCMKRFQQMLIKQGNKDIIKQAAILIPIYVENKDVSLLYTRRAANLRTHRGQISFPGGIYEKSDSSLEETALRETKEEIGINSEDIDVWGTGNPIVRQDMSVLPVIGCVKPDLPLDTLHVNNNEVEDVFVVKVSELVDKKNHRHTQFRGTYSTPTYLGGPYRIWGLTAVVTFMFLKSLISPENYSYHVKYIPDVTKILAVEKK